MTSKAGAAAAYKARKEAFVSNLSGGSIAEINGVTLVAPAAVFLWSALQARKSFFVPCSSTALLVDFLLNVGGILFGVTAYSSNTGLLNLLLILPALVAFLAPDWDRPLRSRRSSKHRAIANGQPKPHEQTSSAVALRPFLTHYRGAMMIITCVAILAVDFPIFPRRFAKVETWGTSLMDLGVGSFVFSAGVVSARSRLQVLSQSESVVPESLPNRLVGSLRQTFPLIVLGLIRLYSVKGLDYAEHVTEYGVHWNFFFTLAFLSPFVEVSDLLTSAIPQLTEDTIAFWMGIVYEIVLDNTSLKRYIITAPRGPDLLSKNREGVFSFIGYLAIFLAGRRTGLIVLAPSASSKANGDLRKDEHAWNERKSLLQNLAGSAGSYILLYVVATWYRTFNLNVSRRLANLPYILWVVAFNNAQLLLFCAIETWVLPDAYTSTGQDIVGRTSSKVMQAFNKNGLAIFLVANLLTGLVNMTIKTLDVSNINAMAILLVYAATLTGLALSLDQFGLKIKL